MYTIATPTYNCTWVTFEYQTLPSKPEIFRWSQVNLSSIPPSQVLILSCFIYDGFLRLRNPRAKGTTPLCSLPFTVLLTYNIHLFRPTVLQIMPYHARNSVTYDLPVAPLLPPGSTWRRSVWLKVNVVSAKRRNGIGTGSQRTTEL